MPVVDVCIPCYNHGRFLEPCVRSVLSQKGCDVRVLVIDNASTDNSAEVAAKIAREEGRVEVRIHESNRGHISSYNEGIEWASGDYFLLLFSDDMLVPHCLARATSIMDAVPDISFAHGREIWLYPGDSLPALDGPQRSSWEISTGLTFIEDVCRAPHAGGYPVGACTAIVRTSAQKQVGAYRTELPLQSDLEMWLRLATRGCVAYTNTVQGIRRMHDANLSNTYSIHRHLDFLQREAAFESFFSMEGLSIVGVQHLRSQVRRNLGEAAYWSSLRLLQFGHVSPAWELMRLALRLARWNAVIPPVNYFRRRRASRASVCQLAEWSLSDGTYIYSNEGYGLAGDAIQPRSPIEH